LPRIPLFERAVSLGQSITFVGSSQNGPQNVAGLPFPRSHEGHSGFTIEDEPAAGRQGILDLVPGALSLGPTSCS
jgi:hypothetical protein